MNRKRKAIEASRQEWVYIEAKRGGPDSPSVC